MVTSEPGDRELRHNALLKEYEVCQANENATAARVWQFTGTLAVIVVGGPLAVLQTRLGSVETALISLAGMALVVFWLILIYRHIRNQQIVYHRMRELEAKLDLRTGLYIALMDHWHHDRFWPLLTNEERSDLDAFRRNELPSVWGCYRFMWAPFRWVPFGRDSMFLMGMLGVYAWWLLIVREILFSPSPVWRVSDVQWWATLIGLALLPFVVIFVLFYIRAPDERRGPDTNTNG